MRLPVRALPAAAALVVAASFALSGCSYFLRVLAIRVPDTVTRPETRSFGAGYHVFAEVVPHDSVNAGVARMRDLDAIAVQPVSGERRVFSRVSAPSVRLRHDSLVFIARREAQVIPLAGTRCVTFQDDAPRWPVAVFTGAVAAVGAGIAVLNADGEPEAGRALGGAAVGTALALPLGAFVWRRHRTDHSVLVLGEGEAVQETVWSCWR